MHIYVTSYLQKFTQIANCNIFKIISSLIHPYNFRTPFFILYSLTSHITPIYSIGTKSQEIESLKVNPLLITLPLAPSTQAGPPISFFAQYFLSLKTKSDLKKSRSERTQPFTKRIKKSQKDSNQLSRCKTGMLLKRNWRGVRVILNVQI